MIKYFRRCVQRRYGAKLPTSHARYSFRVKNTAIKALLVGNAAQRCVQVVSEIKRA